MAASTSVTMVRPDGPFERNQFRPGLSSIRPSTPTRHTRDSQAIPTLSPAPTEPQQRNIVSILSPPEPHPYDSFNNMSSPAYTKLTTTTQLPTTAEMRTSLNAPPSPPVSPVERASLDTVNNDAILYPVADSSMSPPGGPLFNNTLESIEPIEDTDRVVDEHIASRSASLFRGGVPPPNREEYMLVLHFKSNVMSSFNQDRRAWLARERRFLQADRKHVSRPVQRLPAILPASRPIIPSPYRAERANPRTRSVRTTHAPHRGTITVSATPEPRARPVAPNREDKDYGSLPDYCPPLGSLSADPNCLKIEWKGHPLDLSADPNAYLLHPAELKLASTLRLDCATYLTSKRRIFIRRLEVAQSPRPKEFRKTDAQKACKIDVNKASKLWEAYDKVGWLDVKWVRRHME